MNNLINIWTMMMTQTEARANRHGDVIIVNVNINNDHGKHEPYDTLGKQKCF